jgi:hypothetical protein
MPTPNPILPKYDACEFSLFVSYAHADDESNNYWVTALRDAVWGRLKNLDRKITKRQLHFSGTNGPTAGHLSDELRARVARSFGMLLVVGEQYVSSGWCEKELELFVEIFGEQAIKTRLFIAAMSETALGEARKKEQWKKLFGDEQIWIPMYDQVDTNKPLPHVPENKHYPQAFFDNVKKIGNPLIERIQQDFKRSEDSADAQGAVLMPAGAGAADGQQNVIRIGIGPCTDDLDGKAAALKATLERKGVEIAILSRDLLANYDPDNPGSPLRTALQTLDFLVVPVSDVTPLNATEPGGHTALLEQARAGLKSRLRIIWYRPDTVEPSSDKRALEKHLDKFRHLAPLCVSEQAVATELFGAGAGRGLKIYIEEDSDDSNETPYYLLAQELDLAWKSLPPDPERPQLKCAALDWKAIHSADKDAAGVVLTLPAGRKRPDSLQAQISVVQMHLPKNAVVYPGCVALIFSPPPPTVPRHEWPFVNFEKSPDGPSYVANERTRRVLAQFLDYAWKQYRNHLTEPRAAAV